MSTDTATTTQERTPARKRNATECDREWLIAVLQPLLDQATRVERLCEQAQRCLEAVERHIQDLDQRLEQLPPRREAAPSHGFPSRAPLPDKSRSLTRLNILKLLHDHPEGMSRAQLETALGSPKSLEHTIGHMKRDGVIVSKTLGVYVPPPATR